VQSFSSQISQFQAATGICTTYVCRPALQVPQSATNYFARPRNAALTSCAIGPRSLTTFAPKTQKYPSSFCAAVTEKYQFLRRRRRIIVTAASAMRRSSEPRKTVLRSFLNRAFYTAISALLRLDKFTKCWLDKACKPLSTTRNAATQSPCRPAQPSAVHSRCQQKPAIASTGLPSAPARLVAYRRKARASRRATPELARFQGDPHFTVQARSGFSLRLFIPTPICWGGFSQNGFSILLTPKNQFLGNANVCPLCQVTDVTIRYSKISNSGAGIQMANVRSDGGGIALAGERYSVHDLTVDGIDATQLNGSGPLIATLNDWPTNVLNSILINHITGFPDSGRHLLTLEDKVSNPKMWGFQFTNNVVLAGEFPVWSAAGVGDCAHSDVPITSLATCFSSYSFAKNAIVASLSAFPPSKWPAGNYFPIDAGAVEFATFSNGSGGNYQLLSSSPFKNLGTDGKDLGADINALNKAIAGVE